MSEFVVINCVEVEKIAKTLPTSLGDAENVCIDSMGHQTSYVGNESVSIKEKFVNSSRQMSPLRNGLEEPPNKNKKGTSVGHIEANPTQFPAKVTKSIVSNVEELHSDLEIHYSSDKSDTLQHSPSDFSLKQTCSANSLSDCNPKEKGDIEKPPNSPSSKTPKAVKELNSDPISKQTNPLNRVDSVKNHLDMESIDGNDEFKNSLETTSIGGTLSTIDADEKGIGDSDMIESLETTDSNPSIHETNDSYSNLAIENGNATSHEDSSPIEKYDESIGLTEVDERKTVQKGESELENTVEMIPTSKLDSKLVSEEYEAIGNLGECNSLSTFSNPSEISSKAQSSQVVDETPVINVESPKEFKMVSKTDSVSFETREEDNVNSCQDSQPVPLRSEHDKKGVRETTPCCSDIEDGIEEVKMDVHELSNGSDKNQAMSPIYINLDNEVKSIDEEKKKGMDSLKISKVESFTDAFGGVNESKKAEIQNADVKPESKEASNIPFEKIDSKGNCKELKKEDDNNLKSTETTETVEEIKKVMQSRENESTSVKNDASVVEPDSSLKFSFKDILKKGESLESPKDSKQHEAASPEPDETIVIDEIETVPNISRNIDGKNHEAEEILGSGKAPTQITNAKKEDIPSNEGESGKKRTFDSSTEVSKPFSPKRQRFDPGISELGDDVGVTSSEATTVIMDSDDDSATSPQMSDKAAEDENKMEINGRTIQLSGEMLRNLIKASMKSFMKNQVLEKEQLINDRMKKMEAAIDLWRETAKHLEKSMNELTSYTKEFRKCKSQAMKLKPQTQNQPTTSSSNHNRSTSLSLPPSVLRHPLPTQPGPSSNRPMAPSNSIMRPSQPTAPRQVGPGGTRGGPTITQQPNRQKTPNMSPNAPMAQSQPSSSQFNHVMRPMANSHMAQQSVRAPAPRPPMSHTPHTFQGSSSNMIDLTAEDDTSKQTKAAAPPSQRAIRGSVPPPAMPNNAHNSNLVRGPQPETNVVNSSNNQIVRSGGLGHNASPKSLPGSSVQNPNNIINGTSVGLSPPKSGAPVNSSGLANGKAASKTPSTELSSKASSTPGSGTSASSRSLPPSVYVPQPTKHPAPLPVEPYSTIVNTTKLPPPKPSLKISRVAQGIVLSWNMPVLPSNIANIASYQLFAYQETNSAPSSSLWKKVGDVKALPLPMACTLVQFQEGNKYYFSVRAIDQFGRWGEYSDPSSIYLFPK